MPSFYSLPFIKLQALGNDFIFIDAESLLESAARPLLSQWSAVAPLLAQNLCQRRTSIGADGLILAMSLQVPELARLASVLYGSTSKDCDISWTYHNSDGSVSDMCGNGLRCLALWAKEEKNFGNHIKAATALGTIAIDYKNENDITVALGAPKLASKDIPFKSSLNKVLKEPFEIANSQFAITCLNVGNPHCVIFEADFLKPEFFNALNKSNKDDFFPSPLIPIAKAIELDSHFPERTNVEFVRVLDRQHIEVLVWERGCGATLACGSGAVAAAVACVLEKRTERKVSVLLPGGSLLIDWSDDNVVKMTGSANMVFRGQTNISTEQLKTDKNISCPKVPAL